MNFPSFYTFLIFFLFSVETTAQVDSLHNDEFTIHGQTTIIDQYKPSFRAKYTGPHSFGTQSEDKTTITSTLFLGARAWKGGSIYLNPELSGGSGLGQVLGIASFPNGEAFRVGNPSPEISLARLYFRQILPMDQHFTSQEDDVNQIKGAIPLKYLNLIIGKISLTDFFDLNDYSHDPRTQFINWAFMDNGAWDFAANTKGYTPTFLIEYITSKYELRYAFALLPTSHNGMNMNWNIKKAGSHNLEYRIKYLINERNGSLRLLTYFNTGNMGNYNQSILLNPITPDLRTTEKYGHTKYGLGINFEQDLNDYAGLFLRAGWNDGHNESWNFTEIDRTLSFGISADGSSWNRKEDSAGIGYVISGLSAAHRRFLSSGGLGFQLGDGRLNYSHEQASELFYSFMLINGIFLTGDWQFILNPGYNKDRGPVNVFTIRAHLFI